MISADQATGFLNFFLGMMDNEYKTTRKVIAAVPQDKCEWRPDPKAKNALELAAHIPDGDMFFLDGIISGGFNPGGDAKPAPTTIEEILKAYESNYTDRVAKLKALSGKQLAKPVPFFGMMELPAVMYLNLMLMHTSHHRGQLSVYLRPMGSKVPSIYGGSADEPLQMPAGA